MAMFELGFVTATPGALAELERLGVAPEDLLNRHRAGDWGDNTSEADARLNVEAVGDGSRILSAYQLDEEARVYVLTDDGYQVTTILLMSEY